MTKPATYCPACPSDDVTPVGEPVLCPKCQAESDKYHRPEPHHPGPSVPTWWKTKS